MVMNVYAAVARLQRYTDRDQPMQMLSRPFDSRPSMVADSITKRANVKVEGTEILRAEGRRTKVRVAVGAVSVVGLRPVQMAHLTQLEGKIRVPTKGLWSMNPSCFLWRYPHVVQGASKAQHYVLANVSAQFSGAQFVHGNSLLLICL